MGYIKTKYLALTSTSHGVGLKKVFYKNFISTRPYIYIDVEPIKLIIDETRIKSTKEGLKYFNLTGVIVTKKDFSSFILI